LRLHHLWSSYGTPPRLHRAFPACTVAVVAGELGSDAAAPAPSAAVAGEASLRHRACTGVPAPSPLSPVSSAATPPRLRRQPLSLRLRRACEALWPVARRAASSTWEPERGGRGGLRRWGQWTGVLERPCEKIRERECQMIRERGRW
jgi:hypothetical protein